MPEVVRTTTLAVLGGGWMGWTTAGVGLLVILAAALAAWGPTSFAVRGYGATWVGVAVLLGLVVGWMVGLATLVVGTALLFRETSADPGPESVRRRTSEVTLAVIAGALVTGILGFVVERRYAVVERASAETVDAGIANPLVMGGLLLLIGLAFLAVDDDDGPAADRESSDRTTED